MSKHRNSLVNIPVTLDLNDLEVLINNQLKGMIYEDDDLNDNGGDRLLAKVEKNGDIDIALDGQLIEYEIPLKIWIKKGIGPAMVEAEGALSIHFTTHFEIKEDWKIECKSAIKEYKWQQKPVLKLGLFNMPVEMIASKILKKSGHKITERIDHKIQENFNLRYFIRKAWQHFHDPIPISNNQPAWLLIQPRALAMTPLSANGSIIQSTLSVDAALQLSLGHKPDSISLPALPPYLQQAKAEDAFRMHLRIDVDYDYAAQMAVELVEDQSFGSDSQPIQIEALELDEEAGRLKVVVDTTGSYNGQIELTTQAILLPEEQLLTVDDIDMEFKGSNFLMRNMAKLLRPIITTQLEERLRFPLADRLEELKQMIATKLQAYEVTEGIVVSGELDELELESLETLPTAMRLFVASSGSIEIVVNSFKGVEEKLNELKA